MNSSFAAIEEDQSDLVLSNVTAVFAGAIFVINVCLLGFVTKLLRSGYSKRDKYGIIIQFLFVCINDTFSGLLLFLVGLTKVNSYASAFVCANLVFLCSASQIVSQGNITCICAQRYILSRSLRKTNITWSKAYTKCLLVVNIFIGVASLASFLAGMKVKYLPDMTRTCKLANVVQGEVALVASALFVIGIPCIIAGDALCLLTIGKLRATVDVEVRHTNASLNKQPKSTYTSSTDIAKLESTNTSTSQSENNIASSIRARQNKATITLLLILIFFNISVVPVVTAYILVLAGVNLSSTARRMMFFCMYANSSANPVIIAWRVEDVKNAIKDTTVNGMSRIKRFLCRQY